MFILVLNDVCVPDRVEHFCFSPFRVEYGQQNRPYKRLRLRTSVISMVHLVVSFSHFFCFFVVVTYMISYCILRGRKSVQYAYVLAGIICSLKYTVPVFGFVTFLSSNIAVTGIEPHVIGMYYRRTNILISKS